MNHVRRYLDHAAGAPLRPEAARAMAEIAESGATNPSSIHAPGRAARRIVEEARAILAARLDAPPAAVIFVASGTEANATALLGLALANGCTRIAHSAVEHASIGASAIASGLPVAVLPVDGRGRLDLQAAASVLRGPRMLVSVMHANNETGVYQPIADLADLARAHGHLLHVDAAQTLGTAPLGFAGSGVHAISVTAHKIGGPAGVGALVCDPALDLRPLVPGGGQERGRRGGTENVIGLAGFGAALAACDPAAETALVEPLRGLLEAGLGRRPDAVIFGAGAARLAGTCLVAVPGLSAQTVAMALDLQGIAVGTGPACSSGKVRASHVLAAMGVPADLAACAVRISLGWSSTADDVAAFVSAWEALAERLVTKDLARAI